MIKSTAIHTNAFANIITLAYRNLLKTLHDPDRIMDVIIQPALFMLLFGYLFGGAIAGGVKAYLPTLVPGILMQAMLSAASGSGEQIRADFNSGIYTRFKSLPIARIAPLAGQLLGDSFRLLMAASVSLLTGYLIGWHPTVGFQWIVAVILLAIFVGWALSWVFALMGILIKNASLIESISLMLMIILSFLSNAFIPVRTLPKFMQFLAKINPVTYVITAIREILKSGSWSKETAIVLIFGIAIILVFAPLTVLAYNHNES